MVDQQLDQLYLLRLIELLRFLQQFVYCHDPILRPSLPLFYHLQRRQFHIACASLSKFVAAANIRYNTRQFLMQQEGR